MDQQILLKCRCKLEYDLLTTVTILLANEYDACLQKDFQQNNCLKYSCKTGSTLTQLFSYPELFGDRSIHSLPVQKTEANVRVHCLKHY